MTEARADYKTRFQSSGVGTKSKQKPVSVLLPGHIDQVVKAMPNRSEFIRQAILEKLEREGLFATAHF
jgi:hypothetical protein